MCGLPIGTKGLIGNLQISVRKVGPWQEDLSKKLVGSNPCAGKGFFHMRYCWKCTCIIIESYCCRIFTLYKCVYLPRVFVAYVRPIRIKTKIPTLFSVSHGNPVSSFYHKS